MNNKAKHRTVQEASEKKGLVEFRELLGDPLAYDEIAALAYSHWRRAVITEVRPRMTVCAPRRNYGSAMPRCGRRRNHGPRQSVPAHNGQVWVRPQRAAAEAQLNKIFPRFSRSRGGCQGKNRSSRHHAG